MLWIYGAFHSLTWMVTVTFLTRNIINGLISTTRRRIETVTTFFTLAEIISSITWLLFEDKNIHKICWINQVYSWILKPKTYMHTYITIYLHYTCIHVYYIIVVFLVWPSYYAKIHYLIKFWQDTYSTMILKCLWNFLSSSIYVVIFA